MDELLVQIDKNNYSILTNFDTIKAELQQTLANYKGIVVDESTIKQSKADIADLRKMSKEIDAVRKEIKSEWNKPYLEFESKCKELTGLIDEPITEIKNQLDDFEEKRKVEKISHVRELYDESIGEYGDYLPFDSIFKDKWLNATASDKDIRFDLSEIVTKVRSELDAIKALHSEIEEECIRAYKNSGNSLTAAIAKNSDYLAAKEMAKKKLEEEKKAEEEKVVKKQIEEMPEEFINPAEEPAWVEAMEESFTFKIYGKENIERVKEMLTFNDIEYEEV